MTILHNLRFEYLIMASNIRKGKLTKLKSKLVKDGLKVSDAASPFIVIANGGLGNGISVAQISSLLEKFGEVVAINSNSKKPYALAHFKSQVAAIQAVSGIQGTSLHKELESNKTCNTYAFFLETWDVTCDSDDVHLCDELPSGLMMYCDFVTKEQEEQLLQVIEEQVSLTVPSIVCEKLKNRTVLHYGYQFQYGSNDVDLDVPLSDCGLPDFTKDLVSKLMATGYLNHEPNQLTINIYKPGDGIPAHIDNPTAFDEVVSTVSLGSSTVMEMTHASDTRKVLLDPRTLVLFTGASRYHWTHGIRQKKVDIICDTDAIPTAVPRGTRVSLTFRRALQNYATDNPDMREKTWLNVPNTNMEADVVEKHYVRTVYNEIAGHFASTRAKPWPKVVDFLTNLEPQCCILDVGCGSGRYLDVCPDKVMFGCDYSSSLAEICKSKNRKTFICDGLNVPVRSACFDACICIAVLHHFSTEDRRRNGVMELLRVIRPGGRVLIYVWAVEQKLNNIPSHYIKTDGQRTKPHNIQDCKPAVNTDEIELEVTIKTGTQASKSSSIVVHKNRTEFVQQDVLVPWKMKKDFHQEATADAAATKGSSVFYRFYHVFRQHELENLCETVPGCVVVNSYYDSGNWAVVLQKTS